HPLLAGVVRDLELEDQGQRTPEVGEERVQRLGLRQVAREAVEDVARPGVLAREPLADQLDRQVVGDQLAGRENRFHSYAQRATRRDSGAEEIAGRDMRERVLPRDPSSLCPLAGALRPEEQDVERYLRKPS